MFVYACPLDLAVFAEVTVFAPLYCLCSGVKEQVAIFMGVYFWALFCSSICLSILLPILQCLDYHSFIVSLRVG